MEIYLLQIAHGRSGDKGDTSNVCVFARKPEYYDIIKREVTVEKVREYFGDMVKGDIIRYDVPSLDGFNFVMHHALGGGATHSLRLDTLGLRPAFPRHSHGTPGHQDIGLIVLHDIEEGLRKPDDLGSRKHLDRRGNTAATVRHRNADTCLADIKSQCNHVDAS